MNRTRAMIAVFSVAAIGAAATLPAGTLLGMQSGKNSAEESAQVSLQDAAGASYTLLKNSDGTETASYADGRSVRFIRAGEAGISYVSGDHGLLAGLASSYCVYRGLKGSEYHDGEDVGTVTVSNAAGTASGTSAGYIHYSGNGIGDAANSKYIDAPHSGFGSAGARSAAS